MPRNWERKHEKVATLPQFAHRMGRYLVLASALILVSVAGGTIGYHCIADLAWVDSFHMACMILTGMGPVSNMTGNGAKIFSSLYALYSGVAFLSITAVFFAPLIHRVLHILHVEDESSAS